MAQIFFTCRVYSYDSIGNRLNTPTGYAKSFNSSWCDFEELGANDTKRGDGMNAKILYFLGAAPSNPKEFFVKETIYELGALAGKIASSAPAA